MEGFSIKVSIRTKNADRLAKLQARCADFSEPLEQIVKEWSVGNRQKFAASRGAENTGVDQPGGPDWEPLKSKSYQRWKRRRGMNDWLMVATGSLMQALTTEGAFGSFVDEQSATFGTPMDSHDAEAAMYNSNSRPTIFLGRGDRNMIRRNIQNYLSFGPGYMDALADRSAQRYGLMKDAERMDLEFAAVAAGGAE